VLYYNTPTPDLVQDLITHNLQKGIPRLFFKLNQKPFNPKTRFIAIAKSLQLLNPKVKELHFSYQEAQDGSWNIDMSNNLNLDDIFPDQTGDL
jgi:hypothetical protein